MTRCDIPGMEALPNLDTGREQATHRCQGIDAGDKSVDDNGGLLLVLLKLGVNIVDFALGSRQESFDIADSAHCDIVDDFSNTPRCPCSNSLHRFRLWDLQQTKLQPLMRNSRSQLDIYNMKLW